jgi:hypothetical protein
MLPSASLTFSQKNACLLKETEELMGYVSQLNADLKQARAQHSENTGSITPMAGVGGLGRAEVALLRR